MSHPPQPSSVGRLPMLAASAGGLVAFGIVLAVLLTRFGSSGTDGGSDGPAAPIPTVSYGTAPATAVTQIRGALDDIAARCTPPVDADLEPAELRRLDRAVDVILAFAQRYPNAEFPVDDETGHTLSLLLAARDDLSRCAPTVAARITAALPPQYRQPPNTTASTTG